MNEKPVVVVGDGWAALGAVGTLLSSRPSAEIPRRVTWISGAGSRVIAPLPSLESGEHAYGAVEAVVELAANLGIELGEEHSGNFLREFKNKAYREPLWTKSDDPTGRKQACEESLWDPERALPVLFETRFDLTLAEIEEKIREKLTPENFPTLSRVEGNHLSKMRIKNGKLVAAVLSSGQEIECESLIYADRWSSLAKIGGLPKSMSFTRRRDPHGVLQASFTHHEPVGLGVLEGFFGAMNREAGEEFERHVWGYFSSDGMKSYWTICLSADEGEDNHQIAKKLRRMKSTLDKMFVGSSWVPVGLGEQGFMANVREEQVRFEEGSVFASGEMPTEVTQIPGVENLWFLTDGYGPSSAFQQARILLLGHLWGDIQSTSAESKNPHAPDSAQL